MTTIANNPLLQPWTAPFGLPPFSAIRAEHFVPAFDEALLLHRAEIAAHRSITDRAHVRQHARCVRPQRSDALAHRKSLLQPHGVRDLARAAGRRARDVAAARRTSQRDLPRCGAVRPNRCDAPAPQRPRPFGGATAAARSGSTSTSCARAPGFPQRPRRGSPRSSNAWPRYRRASRRTCSPTRRAYRLVLKDEHDLAGLPEDLRAAAHAAASSAARRAAPSSRCRARSSRRS